MRDRLMRIPILVLIWHRVYIVWENNLIIGCLSVVVVTVSRCSFFKSSLSSLCSKFYKASTIVAFINSVQYATGSVGMFDRDTSISS